MQANRAASKPSNTKGLRKYTEQEEKVSPQIK